MLRMPILLGFVIGFGLMAGPAHAGSPLQQTAVPVAMVDLLWEELQPEERQMVDLVASDFYENQLSEQQRNNIAQTTADTYRTATMAEKAELRQMRRQRWRELSEQQKAELVSANHPKYATLTRAQKAPFREFALRQLNIAAPENHKSDRHSAI